MPVGTTLRVSVEVDYHIAEAKLHALGVGLDDNALLHAIGLRVIQWMDDNLDAAGIDEPHTPMSENTIAANPQRSSSSHFSSRYRSRLAQSFTQKVGGGEVTIGTEDEFAQYHHFGTDPYIIRPVNARVLAFMTAQGMAFANIVHHPGIPARPLLPKEDTAHDLAVEVLEGAVDQAIASMGT